MAIGKNSRKSQARSSIRAPKFLDKSSGFYGRLDEPETPRGGQEIKAEGRRCGEAGGSAGEGVGGGPGPSQAHISGADEREEAEVFGLSEGMMEDDGETLLRMKPDRHRSSSSRWRRSSRRKQKEGRDEEEDAARDGRPGLGPESRRDPGARGGAKGAIVAGVEELKRTEEEEERAGRGREPALVHFPVREEADDQVLIRDKKRGREEEGEEERRMRREQAEGMKVVKRNTVKNYRKALDRALRRGWEAFITNLYSVTLTPVTSPPAPQASSPSTKKRNQRGLALVEML